MNFVNFISKSCVVSKLSVQNFSWFLVLEVSWFYHSENCIINCSGIIVSEQHFLLKFWIRNFGSNCHSSLNCFFNLLDKWNKFLRCLLSTSACHSTCCCVQSWNLEKTMSFLDMFWSYFGLKSHFGNCLWNSDDGLKLSDCNWNTISFLRNSLIFWSSSVCNINILKHVSRFFWHFWWTFLFRITNVFPQEIHWYFSLTFFSFCAHMQIKNVLCNLLIEIVFSNIFYNKDCVESWKNRALEINLFGSVFQVIISSINWICRCNYWSSWVKSCCNSGFCNRNGLLFHCFMDSYSVLWSHLVKFINANNTTVSKNHCSAFKLEFTTCSISDDWGCQTSCWWTFTTCINWNWGNSINKFQELRLCYRWVTEQENIDITSKFHSIW